jgi:hypothetical protein
MGNEKTAIFEHVLIQRINRKLSAEAEQLQKATTISRPTAVKQREERKKWFADCFENSLRSAEPKSPRFSDQFSRSLKRHSQFLRRSPHN